MKTDMRRSWLLLLLIVIFPGCRAAGNDDSAAPDSAQTTDMKDLGLVDVGEATDAENGELSQSDAAGSDPDSSGSAKVNCALYDGLPTRCAEGANCLWIGTGRVCGDGTTCTRDGQPLDLCVDVGVQEGVQVAGLYFRKSDGIVAEFPQVFPPGNVEGWGRCPSDLSAGEDGAPPACDCWMVDIVDGSCG